MRRALQIQLALQDERKGWAERMEAACRILEESFPTEDLRVGTPYHEGREVFLVRDRPAYFKKQSRTRRFQLHSGDPNLGQRCDRPIRFEGYEPRGTVDSVVTFAGALRGGHEGLYTPYVIFPERTWDLDERLLVALGDATAALRSHLSPGEAEARLRAVQSGWHRLVLSEGEARLPTLAMTDYGGLAAAEQPGMAGWLNYWSERTARFLGFPDPARDADLLAHSYRTPGGAWLVKLGPEPLDCANAAHLKLVRSVYERFPRLGVRGPRTW